MIMELSSKKSIKDNMILPFDQYELNIDNGLTIEEFKKKIQKCEELQIKFDIVCDKVKKMFKM